MADGRGPASIRVMEASRANLHVVIADDSALVRERLACMLRELPLVEVVAETGDVATTIQRVRILRPHVLILDLDMPGGSGLDVLRQVQAEEIPSLVIILTNHLEPEYQEGALRGGAAAYLDKSRDFLKAVDIIRSLSETPAPACNTTPAA